VNFEQPLLVVKLMGFLTTIVSCHLSTAKLLQKEAIQAHSPLRSQNSLESSRLINDSVVNLRTDGRSVSPDSVATDPRLIDESDSCRDLLESSRDFELSKMISSCSQEMIPSSSSSEDVTEVDVPVEITNKTEGI